MKKHSIFKFMGIILLVILVLTYFIPARAGEVSYLPFGDILTNYIQSYYYFWDTAIFVLAVGAFYGVLNKTSAYKKLLNNLTKIAKPIGKKFIFAIIILFAVISACTGITTALFVFIPFIISIILLLGYDKLVAISATVVPTMIGFIGGLFTTFRDPNNYYGYSAVTFEAFTGIDRYANIIPQLALLVIGVALTILFVNKHIKDTEGKKVKYELESKEDVLFTETKNEEKSVKTWPLLVIIALLFVLMILGLVPWNTLSSNITCFDDFHTRLTELAIKDFHIYNSVISTVFKAFGRWAELGNYMILVVTLVIATLLIKIIYKVKFDDVLDGIIEGAKKMIPTAALMMMAYTVLICTYNNGFFETIISNVSKDSSINYALASLITAFGSLLHVDLYYTASGIFTPILKAVTDESMLNVFALAFQSIYGVVSIIGPTSLMLIFVLSYLDVPYTTWLKYIWRLILALLIVIFATLLILAVI